MTVGEVIREAYERDDFLKLGEVVDFLSGKGLTYTPCFKTFWASLRRLGIEIDLGDYEDLMQEVERAVGQS